MINLQRFHPDEFFMKRVPAQKYVEIIASVLEEDAYYILDPEPVGSGPVYRVAKEDVQIGDEVDRVTVDDGSNVPRYRVKIPGRARTMALSVGTAATLLYNVDESLIALRAKKRVSISFSPNGEGWLTYGNIRRPCLGRPDFRYARDLTVQGTIGTDKFRRKFSNEFQVWMDFAVLIMGQRGVYIHEGPDNIADNGGPSAGCIHLSSPNAEAFYQWIDEPTRILIDFPW